MAVLQTSSQPLDTVAKGKETLERTCKLLSVPQKEGSAVTCSLPRAGLTFLPSLSRIEGSYIPGFLEFSD